MNTSKIRLHSLLAVLTSLAALPASAQVDISARGASIRLGGRLHAQYQGSSAEGSESEFFLRRARLTADVVINDFLSGRVQPEFSGGSAHLTDAYVRLTFSEAFRLTMGQFKRPFDRFELDSSTDMSLVERDGRVDGLDSCAGVGRICSYGRFSSSLGLGNRDQGLLAELSLDRLSVAGSVTNGTGINRADENDEKTFMARIGFQASERVQVAVNYAAKDFVLDSSDEYADAWGVDAQYGGYRDGLLLQAGLLGGDNWKNPDDAGDPSTFLAWQALGSYYFPLSGGRFVAWEPLLRVSGGDPDTDLDDDDGLLVTPGLMLYVQGKNKIGFNLDYYTPDTGDSEWSLKVQTFLYF
ncbi:MAG: porin [Longimicrobiales bacterium]|nr:porin [Longimicrobiales bacterium]